MLEIYMVWYFPPMLYFWEKNLYYKIKKIIQNLDLFVSSFWVVSINFYPILHVSWELLINMLFTFLFKIFWVKRKFIQFQWNNFFTQAVKDNHRTRRQSDRMKNTTSRCWLAFLFAKSILEGRMLVVRGPLWLVSSSKYTSKKY